METGEDDMVELKTDELVFRFPEVHPRAVLRIEFQRTLRIPDDERDYPLPPGLGRFPVRHVDDFAGRVPESWLRRGGTFLPMYQSEAMWMRFHSTYDYPFAVKVATGKINAVTGDGWTEALRRNPQDYMAIPDQPWLDGYCIERGVIRQFVAMPLGDGYSVEEQLTGAAEHGGVQILVHPLNAAHYAPPDGRLEYAASASAVPLVMEESFDMGLAPGGRMRQRIEEDPHPFSHWDLRHRGRCFVHLADALVWREITGETPPTTPLTAEEYARHGLPWFEFYGSDGPALAGGKKLGRLESITDVAKRTGRRPLPQKRLPYPKNIISLRRGLSRDEVREGSF